MKSIILTKQEVKNLLRFKSDTSLYTLENKDKNFPAKIKIGLRRVGYKADEIYSWIESRKVSNHCKEE